jgi:hypothetical protein
VTSLEALEEREPIFDSLQPLWRRVEFVRVASEEEREKATVYMEGLAQMRREWARKKTS